MDNAAMLQTIEQAMARAGLDTRSGPLQNVMAIIEGALGHARDPSGPSVADVPDTPSGQ